MFVVGMGTGEFGDMRMRLGIVPVTSLYSTANGVAVPQNRYIGEVNILLHFQANVSVKKERTGQFCKCRAIEISVNVD